MLKHPNPIYKINDIVVFCYYEHSSGDFAKKMGTIIGAEYNNGMRVWAYSIVIESKQEHNTTDIEYAFVEEEQISLNLSKC